MTKQAMMRRTLGKYTASAARTAARRSLCVSPVLSDCFTRGAGLSPSMLYTVWPSSTNFRFFFFFAFGGVPVRSFCGFCFSSSMLFFLLLFLQLRNAFRFETLVLRIVIG